MRSRLGNNNNNNNNNNNTWKGEKFVYNFGRKTRMKEDILCDLGLGNNNNNNNNNNNKVEPTL